MVTDNAGDLPLLPRHLPALLGHPAAGPGQGLPLAPGRPGGLWPHVWKYPPAHSLRSLTLGYIYGQTPLQLLNHHNTLQLHL